MVLLTFCLTLAAVDVDGQPRIVPQYLLHVCLPSIMHPQFQFIYPSVNLGLCSADRLKIYTENFEKAYIDSTVQYYMASAPEYLANYGVQAYMEYAHTKLLDEEERAKKYLETSQDCPSVEKVDSFNSTLYQQWIFSLKSLYLRKNITVTVF